MSVTISIQNPDMVESHCDFCEGESDCPFCGGEGIVTLPHPDHEMNLSNSNARCVLASVGLDDEWLCDSVPAEDVPAVLRRILLVINTDGRTVTREDDIRDNWISIGLDSEGVKERLQRLAKIFKAAADKQCGVRWG